MKRTNVYLEEEQSRLLRHLSIEEGRSFTDIVREALNEYLSRRGVYTTSPVTGPRSPIDRDDWRQRFDAALRRIREGVDADVDRDHIESEITSARDEVRQERARRRRSAGA